MMTINTFLLVLSRFSACGNITNTPNMLSHSVLKMWSVVVQVACCAHMGSCYFPLGPMNWHTMGKKMVLDSQLSREEKQSPLVYTRHAQNLNWIHETGIVSTYRVNGQNTIGKPSVRRQHDQSGPSIPSVSSDQAFQTPDSKHAVPLFWEINFHMEREKLKNIVLTQAKVENVVDQSKKCWRKATLTHQTNVQHCYA